MAQKERPTSCWMPPFHFTTHHPSLLSGVSQIAPYAATASIPALIPALDLSSEWLNWSLIGLLTSSSPTSICLPCCPHPRVPLQSAGGTSYLKPPVALLCLEAEPVLWHPGLEAPSALLLGCLPQATGSSRGFGHGVYSFLLPRVQLSTGVKGAPQRMLN